MKTTIGQQISEPEGSPGDFQAELVRQEQENDRRRPKCKKCGKPVRIDYNDGLCQSCHFGLQK